MNREENYVDVIESILPDFQTAAESVSRKWPQATNPEDLFQDLVIHFLERPGSLEKLANLEQVARVKRLAAIGHEKASKARDDYGVFSGQVSYSVHDVQGLLHRGAATTTIVGFEAGCTDVQVGLEELRKKTPRYHLAIVRRFVDSDYNAKDPNARKLLQRAIQSLTVLMNRINTAQRYNHDNGGRHRNNHQARLQVEQDYLGGV